MTTYYGPLKPLSSLTATDLRNELDAFYVTFNKQDIKPDLQSRWSFHELGFIEDNSKSSSAWINKDTEWCRMPKPPFSDLHKVVEDQTCLLF